MKNLEAPDSISSMSAGVPMTHGPTVWESVSAIGNCLTLRLGINRGQRNFTALMGREFPSMDKVTKFRKRAQTVRNAPDTFALIPR
jgi:hypothetical protein